MVPGTVVACKHCKIELFDRNPQFGNRKFVGWFLKGETATFLATFEAFNGADHGLLITSSGMLGWTWVRSEPRGTPQELKNLVTLW